MEESKAEDKFSKPVLPYAADALEPHLSKETLEYHYGKHHCGYYNKLCKQLEGDHEWADKSLDFLVKNAKGGMFNNAAQIWNHSFYWNGMSGNGGGNPTGKAKEVIEG